MPVYMFRRGDGNEGNFPRFMVDLSTSDNPYDAIRALLASEYIAGKSVRRWIIAHTEVDGEADYGISATVHEGPKGEQAFGAAWVTAELQPMKPEEVDYEAREWSRKVYTLRDILDAPAWRMYRKALRA